MTIAAEILKSYRYDCCEDGWWYTIPSWDDDRECVASVVDIALYTDGSMVIPTMTGFKAARSKAEKVHHLTDMIYRLREELHLDPEVEGFDEMVTAATEALTAIS